MTEMMAAIRKEKCMFEKRFLPKKNQKLEDKGFKPLVLWKFQPLTPTQSASSVLHTNWQPTMMVGSLCIHYG